MGNLITTLRSNATMNRIRKSKLSVNGLECVRCGVALKPMFEQRSCATKERTDFPFFCPHCYPLYRRLYDNYGKSDFLDERDRWFSELSHNKNNIYM